MSVNTVSGSGIQNVALYDENGNVVGSTPKDKVDESVFTTAGTIDDSDNSDKFETTEDDTEDEKINIDYVSTDGDEDGKLNKEDVTLTAFKGIAKLFTTPFTEAAKGNFMPLITTALSIAGFSAAGKIFGKTAVMLGGGVLGLAGGGAQTIKGISRVYENWGKEGGTDGETKRGIEEMAQGLFTMAGSGVAVAGGVKSLNNLKAQSGTNFGSLYEQNANGKFVAKEGVTTGDKLSAYWQDRKAVLLKGKTSTTAAEGANDTQTSADDSRQVTDGDEVTHPMTDGDETVHPVRDDVSTTDVDSARAKVEQLKQQRDYEWSRASEEGDLGEFSRIDSEYQKAQKELESLLNKDLTTDISNARAKVEQLKQQRDYEWSRASEEGDLGEFNRIDSEYQKAQRDLETLLKNGEENVPVVDEVSITDDAISEMQDAQIEVANNKKTTGEYAPSIKTAPETNVDKLQQAYKSQLDIYESLKRQEPAQGTIEHQRWLNNKTAAESYINQIKSALNKALEEQTRIDDNLAAADFTSDFYDEIFNQFYNPAV